MNEGMNDSYLETIKTVFRHLGRHPAGSEQGKRLELVWAAR